MTEPHRGTALVRRPGPRLAEGILTHIPRTRVDVHRACAQHAAYVAALKAAGWQIVTCLNVLVPSTAAWPAPATAPVGSAPAE